MFYKGAKCRTDKLENRNYKYPVVMIKNGIINQSYNRNSKIVCDFVHKLTVCT